MRTRKPFSAMRIAIFGLLFCPFVSALNEGPAGLDGIDAPTPIADSRTHSLNLLSQQERKPTKVANQSSYKVVLDPGHGGKDLGAQGFFSISEKQIALTLAKMVQRDIERTSKTNPDVQPIQVLLTREGDHFLTLKERVTLANSSGADLFVSLHANSSQFPRVRGFEVYFLNAEATDEQATKLARIENAGLSIPAGNTLFSILSDVQATNHVNESSAFAESVFSAMATKAITQARSVRQGPFTVLHGTTMPAILIEVGYVTNVEDALNLSKDSYLKRLSSAISYGIFEHALKQKRTNEVRKLNAESYRWPKAQRTSSPQSNAPLSHTSGG